MNTSPPSPVPPGSTGDGLTTTHASAEGFRGFRRYSFWSMAGMSIGLLAFLVITGPVPFPPDPVGTIAYLGVVIVGVAVVRLTGQHIPRTPGAPQLAPEQWRAWALVASLASLTVSATLVVSGEQIFWPYAPALVASLMIATLPRRRRRIAVPAAIAVAACIGLVIGIVLDDAPAIAFAIPGATVTAFLLFLTLTSIWTWDVAVQLDEARRTAATLAVTNERLRFAADLHDIQGHHLQVIALKSELATRVVRADPDAAEREMSAVQQLAIDALRDTRAVVHGYRRTTLDAEIANAVTVLGSAGIDARLHLEPDLPTEELSEETRHLLGLVVREAVTNVLRHSDARRATVTLVRDDLLELAIVNDGVSGEATSEGGGLRGLAERLRSAGGELTWQRTGDRFEVRVQLSLDRNPETLGGPFPRAATEGET